MSVNVPGQYSLTIGGQKWSMDGEPTCEPNQIMATKVQDGAGRVVGDKETQAVPTASFSVILAGDKSLAKLAAATEKSTTVEIRSESTRQTFKLTEARRANKLAINGHLAQVEMQGVVGVWID